MSTSPQEPVVIAAEQKAVDHAYACYEARLAEMTDGSSAQASASGKDSIANRAEAESNALEYRLEGEPLVVLRIDTQESDESQPETWYVGRRSVFDVATRDQVVVRWTNPLAVAWRQANPSAPGEVLLRRRLNCDGNTVKNYRDEISRVRRTPGGAVGKPAASPIPSPGELFRPAEEQEGAVDEFLLLELDRARTDRMRDIVETIQPDQMDLVADSPDGVLVIQGGPGTGKSAVGLHRVTWLIDNKHFRAEEILVVGPHSRFLEYVGKVLPTLGTRDVTAVELARLWEGPIRGTDTPQTRLVKSDDRMAVVLRRRVEGNYRPDAVDALTSVPSIKDEEPDVTVTLGSAPLRIPRSKVMTLLDQARNGPGGYRVRRDRFRDLVVDQLLAVLVADFPQRSRERTVRRDLERHRVVTTLVERTWPQLSPEEALRSLFNSPEKLRESASQVLTEDEQSLLLRPTAESAAEEPWTIDDLVCLEELRLLIAGESPRRYPHIVIDEAQDLTPMQARSLRRRCPNGSMTVLGDLAQATGPHEYANWERTGKLLARKNGWHLKELRISYRVPAQIMEFVAPLARAIAPSVPFPGSVKYADGDAVRLIQTTPWQLLDEVVAQMEGLAGSDGRSQRSIAVIVPDDSDWLEQVQQRIAQAEVIPLDVRRAISVIAAAQAKGMEFDHVLVLDPTTIADRGPAGLRQLYVALTRSTQSLSILHTSPLPAALLPEADSPDSADGAPAMAPGEQMCTRFHSGGDRCRHTTSHADGWCKKEPCGGYRTQDPLPTNGYRRHPSVPADADREARLELTATQIRRLRVTTSVIKSFVASHGGTTQEAECEIRADIEEFLQRAQHSRQTNGYWLLDLDGYRFVLSSDASAVTAYQTVHAERSYAQFKVGIPSRYAGQQRRQRELVEEAGRLTDTEAIRSLDVASIHVNGQNVTFFAECVPEVQGLPQGNVRAGLLTSLRADLDSGAIVTGPKRILIIGSSLTWALSVDGRALKFMRQHTMLDAEIRAVPKPQGAVDADLPTIGDELRVRVGEHGDGRHWRVMSVSEYGDHRFLLSLRAGEPEPKAGERLDVWVFGEESGVWLVSSSSFGRAPIAPQMALRYQAALNVLPDLVAGTIAANAPDHLSDLKGMANRCLRRDQADWLQVWTALGRPEADQLNALSNLARQAHDAVTSADQSALGQLASAVRDSGWAAALAGADHALLPPPPAVPEAAAKGSGGSLHDELESTAEEDRACDTHEAVRYELKATLLRAGRRSKESALVDLTYTGDDGPVLYEVLSAGCTTHPDVRAGAARLLEINHTSRLHAKHLFLVLCDPPAQAWVSDSVRHVLGVSLIWRTSDGWDGHDISQALGERGPVLPS
ncbi:AAA family ATPase [Streptomyces sp. NBC_00441]|uniref:HelD family protein n=1 Tax=Streptomyces sp. NBC_00441 TaxID=2975742 RepID=UPI002E29E33A|nr:UvrD-helicase domain-containing protein [Streptomyces sp. NBC_00441]